MERLLLSMSGFSSYCTLLVMWLVECGGGNTQKKLNPGIVSGVLFRESI